MTRWRRSSETVAPEAVLDEIKGLRSAGMNDDCGETIETVEHGSFLLIRTGPRFAVVEQRADRVYPIKPGEREGEPMTPERVGYCGGRSRLALRGGSAAAIPAALRPRRPDRAIASVAITRPGGRKPQRRRPAPPEQPRYRYRAPSVSSCSMIAPRHCSDAVLVSP